MNNRSTIVIGIGGMGGNALNTFVAEHDRQAYYVVVNTEEEALCHSLAPHKILIGKNLLQGRSAGGNVDLGKAAAQENLDEISAHIKNADTVCLVAGLGGGTGSGAIQIVANHALNVGKKVVCIVSTPFQCEGKERDIAAREALRGLKSIGAEILVFNNQDLFKTADGKTTFADALKNADETIFQLIGKILETESFYEME